MNANNLIAKHRLVPVVVLDRAEDASPLAEALVTGGLPIAEITFRTDCAAACMKAMAERNDILVGAGTCVTADQVDIARDNGCTFIVSPGFHEKVVARSLELSLPVFPGVATPSDIARAMDYGLGTVKFFPAETYGGAKALKAISAPYHQMKFVPTGGINASNVADYLALDCVTACGGSWMVDRKLVNDGNFSQITEITRAACDLV